MKVLHCDPETKGFSALLPEVRYSQASEECMLQIVRPWNKNKCYPLFVFVQGSGWKHPHTSNQLPQLCRLSEMGYVCATIVHRNAIKGSAFPAFVEDVKCAIRFLRANSEEYCIDPGRVALCGTSSGGNAALLCALSGDDPKYKTEEFKEYSDSVKLAISCFGPTNIHKLIDPRDSLIREDPVFKGLSGNNDFTEVMSAMSPVLQVVPGKKYPPIMLLGGNADKIVRFSQAEELCEALIASGNSAELVMVDGAEHEGNFWSESVLKEIYGFLSSHI